MSLAFDGQTILPMDEPRLASNLARVLRVLQDGAWHDLAELRRVGGSAADSRLRDLRKARWGGHIILSRRDPAAPTSGRWEYRCVTSAEYVREHGVAALLQWRRDHV